MKKWHVTFMLSVYLFFNTRVLADAADDVAMVMDIRNGKAYYESGARQGKEVTLVDFLTEGDKIRLDPQTTLILNYFPTGIKEELTGPGTIMVGKSASQTDGKVVVKQEKSISLPPKLKISKSELQQFGGILTRIYGKSGQNMMLLSLKKTAIRTLQPVFRWQPVKKVRADSNWLQGVPGNVFPSFPEGQKIQTGSNWLQGETYRTWIQVDTYRLKVVGPEDTIYLDVAITGTNLIYPKPDLSRGKTYEWTVSGFAEDTLVIEDNGEFSILTVEQVRALEQDEQAIKKQYLVNTAGQSIALASLYQHYGLSDDTREVLRRLHYQYPENDNLTSWFKSVDPNFEVPIVVVETFGDLQLKVPSGRSWRDRQYDQWRFPSIPTPTFKEPIPTPAFKKNK